MPNPWELEIFHPWELVNIGAEYQPLRAFGISGLSWKDEMVHKDLVLNMPKYTHWLCLLNDYYGYFANVFYPKNRYAKKGLTITVIFIGTSIKIEIPWIHGREGLFQSAIIPALNADAFLLENPDDADNALDSLLLMKGVSLFNNPDVIFDLI